MQTQNKVIQLHPPTANLNRLAANIERVRDALAILNEHRIDVIDIDINRPMPVIRVPVCRGVKKLGEPVPYSFHPSSRGRVTTNRVVLPECKCRIEYDTCGH